MAIMANRGLRPAPPAAQGFDELYRRELAGVLALAHVLSGSRSAAEELAQEAFLAAHQTAAPGILVRPGGQASAGRPVACGACPENPQRRALPTASPAATRSTTP